MRWQLNPLFNILLHDFPQHCAVYHEGSGATHLLAGDSARVLVFFQQASEAVGLPLLEQKFPEINDLKGLLLKLQRMHLVLTLE